MQVTCRHNKYLSEMLCIQQGYNHKNNDIITLVQIMLLRHANEMILSEYCYNVGVDDVHGLVDTHMHANCRISQWPGSPASLQCPHYCIHTHNTLLYTHT